MTLDEFVGHLGGVTFTPSGVSARCPAHDDRVASLSVSEGEGGRLLVHCHAGCSFDQVTAALGLTAAHLAGARHIVAEYPYTDAAGAHLYTVQRWSPKDFTVTPAGLKPAQRTIYNAPWVAHAVGQGDTVYVVEGERDVETLREFGHVGTCNPGGAGVGKWLPHYSESFRGGRVVVIADNDEPGRRHARAVFDALAPVVDDISLQQPLYGKDATDLLRSGYPITHTETVPAESLLAMVRMSEVRERITQWAWPLWVPFGTLTMIDGDPGDGKSTLTCDLVARWTSGREMPDGTASGGPHSCIMVSAEDDPAATIRPRLRVAGANLAMVHSVTGNGAGTRGFNLGADLPALEAAVEKYGARVVILDPLMAFMPAGEDGYVDADVRRVLYPLSRLAETHRVAVVVVRHLTKSATRAMYAGSGSIGLIGAARAGHMVKPDPINPGKYVIATVKSNLAPKPKSLSYEILGVNGTSSVIKWLGEVDYDANTLFDQNSSTNTPRSAERAWALADIAGFPLSRPAQIKERLLAEGMPHQWRTVERALKDLREAGAVLVTKAGEYYRAGTNPWQDETSPSVISTATATHTAIGVAVAVETTEGDNGPETPAVDDALPRPCDVCGNAETIRWDAPGHDRGWFCRDHGPWAAHDDA